MHWNSIKTLKLSPRSLNVPCCYIRISFFRDIPHSLLYGKKGKSPTVLKQRHISYRLLLMLLPLWVKVSHRHYQYFNAIHPIVFLEIYGALLIKKEIFCRFWALIIIEDVLICFPRYEAAMFTRVHWTTQPPKPSPSAARQPAERDLGAVARQSYKQCRCCAGGPSP